MVGCSGWEELGQLWGMALGACVTSVWTYRCHHSDFPSPWPSEDPLELPAGFSLISVFVLVEAHSDVF